MTAAKKAEPKDEKKSLNLDGGDPPADVKPAGAADKEKADKEMGAGEPDITDTTPHAPKSEGQAGTDDPVIDEADKEGDTKRSTKKSTSTKKSAPAKRKKDEKPSFDKAVQDKGVLSAQAGLVQGTVDSNMVSVPILRLSTVGWIGQAPLEIVAEDIDDLREVLDELESQI